MTTKLDRMESDPDSLLPLKSHDPLIMWSGEITWQTKISSLTIPMATKFGKVVIYHEELPLIKLLGPSIT